MQNFQVVNNQNLANSKIFKISPLLEKLKIICQQFGTCHKFWSIDECMIMSDGLNGVKQFNEQKPIRIGQKMWISHAMLLVSFTNLNCTEAKIP